MVGCFSLGHGVSKVAKNLLDAALMKDVKSLGKVQSILAWFTSMLVSVEFPQTLLLRRAIADAAMLIQVFSSVSKERLLDMC